MFKRCGFLLLLFFVVQPAFAEQHGSSFLGAEQSFTPQFEYFVDSDRAHTIETISRLPESAFTQAPPAGYVGGYNRAVHWLRFTLPASESPGEPLIMRAMPTYADYITLYQPDQTMSETGFAAQKSGELAEDWTKKIDRAFVFELQTSDQPRTLYLRVESSNSNMLVAEIYTPQGYLSAIQTDDLLSGLFIGLLLTLIAMNISHGKWRMDASFRYYVIFIFASLMVFLSNNGWLALWLPARWLYWIIYLPQLTTLFYMASLAAFYHSLFGFERKQSPVYYWLSRGYLLVIGLGLASLLFDFYVDYMPFLMSITMAYLIWVAVIALTQALRRQGEGQLLFIAAVFGFSGILGTALSLNGLLSGGIWLMYSYTGGILASIIVFQGIMSRRIRLIEQQHGAALREKEHAEQLAERERADKEQKAQFISMLSHELKTPLSVISMGSAQSSLSDKARSHLQQAINDMSRVIDRCAVLEQVDHQVQTRWEALELTHLIDTLIRQSQFPQRVQWQPPQEDVLIQSDTDWLRVILSNLIDNALKYSPEQSLIDIRLTREPGYICLDVGNWTADPLPDGDKIFAKYYRAKSAHKQTGSGLGLYIVNRLVSQLGGSISYRTTSLEPGRGPDTALNPEARMNQIVMHLCLPDQP